MTAENRITPEWSQRERQSDLAWIADNHVGQGEIDRSGTEGTERLVHEYDPSNQELVVMLLKPFNRTSSYCPSAQPSEDREAGGVFS
jgi:hypothetical protein